VKNGDFIYFDPPYPRGASDEHGFSRYTAQQFGVEDHRRLARYANTLADKGIHVLVTEAARKDVLRNYSTSFRVTQVRAASLIAASTNHRRFAYEAILTSYDTE
jgi:site-specific DNA-adenine methylase